MKARLFVTSWNMSGANSSRIIAKACLPQWIPVEGYDIYVVVLQESNCAQEITRAVSRHLGGQGHFTCFSTLAGDTRLPDGE